MAGLMLEEHELLYLESEDLESAFNLFSVLAAWLGFFAYAKKVDSSAFGLPAGKHLRPALSVIPMGWHSAVALVQEAVGDLVLIGQRCQGNSPWRREGLCPIAKTWPLSI